MILITGDISISNPNSTVTFDTLPENIFVYLLLLTNYNKVDYKRLYHFMGSIKYTYTKLSYQSIRS